MSFAYVPYIRSPLVMPMARSPLRGAAYTTRLDTIAVFLLSLCRWATVFVAVASIPIRSHECTHEHVKSERVSHLADLMCKNKFKIEIRFQCSYSAASYTMIYLRWRPGDGERGRTTFFSTIHIHDILNIKWICYEALRRTVWALGAVIPFSKPHTHTVVF